MRPHGVVAAILLVASAVPGCLIDGTDEDPALQPEDEPPSPIEVAGFDAPRRIIDGDTVSFWIDFQNTAAHRVNETLCLKEGDKEVACVDLSFAPGETLLGMNEYQQETQYGIIDTPFIAKPPPGTTTTYRILDLEHKITSRPMPLLGAWIEGKDVDLALVDWHPMGEDEWAYRLDVRYKKDILEETYIFMGDHDSYPGREIQGTAGETQRLEGTVQAGRDSWSGEPGDHVDISILMWRSLEGEDSDEPDDFRWDVAK